jgi:predicted nucleotidyltransferase
MDLSEPASLVMAPGTAAVIRVLAGAEDAFTIRQVGRLAGVSHARAAQVVAQLDRQGVVDTEDRGGSRLCTLNREHLATPALIALVELRRSMLELIRQEIESWSMRPLHASVFGSAARGDGDVTSDLDVLVIRPDDIEPGTDAWSEQLRDVAGQLRRATGNPVAWFDTSRDELRQAMAAGEPILEQWRLDSVHLTGSTLAAVLKEVA